MSPYGKGSMAADSKKKAITSTNQMQRVDQSDTMHAHFEAISQKATLLEINRQRMLRKIKNLET